jgi:Ca2+-binding RTX toxin-like protein
MTFARTLAFGVTIPLSAVAIVASPLWAADIEVKIDNFTFNPKQVTVIVNGSAGDDNVSVTTGGSTILVNGLAARVTIDGAEASNDSLVINGLAGNDTINASTLPAGMINLTINSGVGNDTITGP